MPALNRVQLIGRLGKDPESKYTPTGKKVTHFSLAISQHWKVERRSQGIHRMGECGSLGPTRRGLPGISQKGQPGLYRRKA